MSSDSNGRMKYELSDQTHLSVFSLSSTVTLGIFPNFFTEDRSSCLALSSLPLFILLEMPILLPHPHTFMHPLLSSVAQLCPILCDPTDCSKPGFPVHHQLPELAQTLVHWIGDAIQPSHSLSSPSPPAFNFPSIRVFSSESVLHIRRPKYWSFSFSASPSNEY